jgi:hypothetical protein
MNVNISIGPSSQLIGSWLFSSTSAAWPWRVIDAAEETKNQHTAWPYGNAAFE